MDLFIIKQYIIIIFAILCPIAWFISEFKSRREFRLLLGVLSIIEVIFFVGAIARYSYDDTYGYANQSLIEISIKGIEMGKADIVLSKFQQFLDEYQHPYGSRSHYDDFVIRYVSEIKTELNKN